MRQSNNPIGYRRQNEKRLAINNRQSFFVVILISSSSESKNKNAEGRSRTDMGLLPPDFESGAYTNFATPARIKNDKTIRRMRQLPEYRNARAAKIIANHRLTVVN